MKNKIGLLGYERRYPDTGRYPIMLEIQKDKKYLKIYDGYKQGFELPINEIKEFIKE